MPPLLEVLIVLALLGLRIWVLDGLGVLTWLATLAPILFVAASWLARGDNWKSLGLLSAYFFQRNKNLYLLAFLHAILAVSIKYFLPDARHHNLKIGPGFLNY